MLGFHSPTRGSRRATLAKVDPAARVWLASLHRGNTKDQFVRLSTAIIVSAALLCARPSKASASDGAPPVQRAGQDVGCLVTEVYFEARGEGANGMVAAAFVALNRARLDGQSVCEVTSARRGSRCEFSYRCAAAPRHVDPPSWRRAEAVARRLMGVTPSPDPVGGATMFGVCAKTRAWHDAAFVRRVGRHCFYRRAGEGATPPSDAEYVIRDVGRGDELELAEAFPVRGGGGRR